MLDFPPELARPRNAASQVGTAAGIAPSGAGLHNPPMRGAARKRPCDALQLNSSAGGRMDGVAEDQDRPVGAGRPASLAAPTASRPPDGLPGEVTQLLQRWSQGDEAAFDRMLPMVYDELRRMAQRHLQRERDGHTLQGTSLVHEVYLRLAEKSPAQWQSRAHFFGWASTLMRHILIDHARSRQAAKRGGGVELLSLDAMREDRGDAADVPAPAAADSPDLVAVDQALRRLERLDPQQGRVVELRYFCGLSVAETAEALEVSPATVKREWVTARAWLLRELGRLKDAS
jgi:RNA polymerase sigma factor (TIGR02999 family)